MNKMMNLRNLAVLAIAGSAVLFAGCSKESVTSVGGPMESATVVNKVTLNEDQTRNAQEMYAKLPKLRYWDEVHHRFIEINPGTRDLIFSDPDEGFTFDDPDGNNVMVFSEPDGDYIVFSSGFGVSGQGGGGLVVAGNTALDIDVAVCFSLEEVAEGDGFGSIFGGDTGWTEFGAVFGISGDFEALAEADPEDENFNPFEFLHGFAEYFIFSDDLSGTHEVFDWMSEDADSDLEDLASSFVMDFTNFNLYFASGGTITVSGGQMSFEGTYLEIADLFESFLEEDGFGDEDPEVNEVMGYGSMGCN